MNTFYDFSATRIEGQTLSMAEYADQVLLVVNTASECGYTPQYAGLQELYQACGPERFAVLGFPCNQFGGQEPLDNPALLEFCISRFGVEFPLFQKCEVNGAGALPLWRWLTKADSAFPQPIKWNFTKFLINRQGNVVKRYEPAVHPHELLDDINQLLQRP
jgi:glutathione peroxidase